MPLSQSVGGCVVALALFAPASPAWSCELPKIINATSVQEVTAFFAKQPKKVVTFLGYSGAEYEDKAAMLAHAGKVLDGYDPRQTIVNIGASLEGIGAVYELAKQKGFATTGIVSTQAHEAKSALAPCVDTVFFVEDASWGGLVPGTTRLAPTSQAMVQVSDEVVAIGGGEISRDELEAAQRMDKKWQVFPADMNHAIAREKALKKGQPAPTDFSGAIRAGAGSGGPGKRGGV